MKSISCFTRAGKPARFAALLMCAALLAGCGGNLPINSASPVPTEIFGEVTPRPGGLLTLPMPSNSELKNPLLPATREMQSIYGMIYENLLTTDDAGAPVPCLAENWEINQNDGSTITVMLRDAVKWQVTDRALNADDVVFTWNQIKSLSNDTAADYPYDYVTKYISSCTKMDDRTVKFTLKKPFYGALQALMFPILPVDGGYENGATPNLPIGTGPYEAKSYEKGKSISLKANQLWWRNPPLISTIEVRSYPDNPSEISSLTLRQLDAVQTEDLTVTQYRDSGTAGIYEYPTRYFEFIALNFTSADIQDKKIRQAIAYAIDRREIVSYTYVNHAVVTDSPVPPDSWLYDGRLIEYDHSVDEARRLIELSGWQDNYDKDGNPLKDELGNPAKDKDGKPLVKDGYYDTSPDGVKRSLSLTLLTNMDEGNTLRNDAAVLLKGQLEKAGFRITLKSLPWKDYSTALKQKSFDLAMCGCYLSPVPDFTALVGTGGTLNAGKYSDPETDQLLDDILHCYDSSSTLKLKIDELRKKISSDLPIISLYFHTHSLLYSPSIRGVADVKEDSAFAGISQWYSGN